MAAKPLPLGSYSLPAPAAACRRLVNCFVQQAPPEQPRGDVATLIRAPGISAFADTAQSEVRGFGMLGALVYACAGSKLYRVDPSGTLTLCTGTAITGTGPVRISANATKLSIAPGNGDGFTSDGATVAQITDPDFTAGGGGADPIYVDGYNVYRRPGTRSFINSGIEDADSFNGLDIGSANGSPGNIVGLQVNNRELIIVKEFSTELWYNAANLVGTPFSRSPDGYKQLGCAASGSLSNQDNSPVMLASDKTFRKLQGVWQRISQHGIESIVQRMALRSDCLALPYACEGHLFVAFSFASAGRTLVFDMTTGEWAERESLTAAGVSLGAWRVQAIIDAYGKTLVGDRTSGKIGLLDPDTYEEWGDPQVMSWTYPTVYAQGARASHRSIEFGFTGGQGTATGQGQDPKLTLFMSDDGGNEFRARGTKSLGVMGAYQTVLRFDNNGESKNRVYRGQMSDPVRMFALDTQLDVEGAR
jgi:hypothetical protein